LFTLSTIAFCFEEYANVNQCCVPTKGRNSSMTLFTVQYAKAMGFQVIAMDQGADKLEFCKSLGAQYAIDCDAPDIVEQVGKISGGSGAHAVICLATNPSAFKISVDILRRRGIVVAVGLPAGITYYLELVYVCRYMYILL
jgi:D-arabinose 1-dehydrogenase-like Zn-dependent alcohol dehydrogenase